MTDQKFFCPLCGMEMICGAFHYWCEKHGAFKIRMNDDRPVVEKVDPLRLSHQDQEDERLAVRDSDIDDGCWGSRLFGSCSRAGSGNPNGAEFVKG